MKRIIICSDGTWNKPEEDLTKDFPTNVLKFSRAIKPVDDKGVAQTVFYDWGIGSYHDKIGGGGFGAGLDKNIIPPILFKNSNQFSICFLSYLSFLKRI